MTPATPHAAMLIQQARAEARSLWVRDAKSKAIVGYLTPEGVLVKLANAGLLYRKSLKRSQGDE